MGNADAMYAVYEILCDERIHDFNEVYFAFIAKIVRDNRIDIVNVSQISDLFNTKYNITLPQQFINHLVSWGMEHKAIVKVKDGVHCIFNRDILDKFIFDTNKEAPQLWKLLVEKFTHYCDENNFRLQVDKIEEYILDTIDRKYNDEIMEDTAEENYAWHKFLIYVEQTDEKLFEFISSLSISKTFQNAIFYVGVKSLCYEELTVYLDSPMIFALLGIDDKERTESYKLLIQKVQTLGGNVLVFDHNLREVEDIMYDARKLATSPNYDVAKANNVCKYFHDELNSNIAKITRFCDNLVRNLNELGIAIKQTNYDTHAERFQEDEADLQRMIELKYQENGREIEEKKKRSIAIDVKSINMVYRERRGVISSKIELAKHLMLTTNNTVANVSKIYANEKSSNHNYIPACISVDLFGAIMWLSSPVEMKNYCKLKLLADCYDYLQPSKKMLEKYSKSLEEAKKRNDISDEQFLILRNDPIVSSALMDITHGDYAHFDELITYQKVLEAIDETRRYELRKEETAHAETKEKNEQLKEKNEQLKEKNEQLEIDNERRVANFARKVYCVCVVVCVVVYVVVYALVVMEVLPYFKPYFERYRFLYTCCCALLAFLPASVIFKPVKLWLNSLSQKIATKTFEYLKR